MRARCGGITALMLSGLMECMRLRSARTESTVADHTESLVMFIRRMSASMLETRLSAI